METLQHLIDFFATYGYQAVFGVLILCGFGLPVPEDITLVAGGIISGLGYTNVHWMFAVAMAGVVIGDSTLFLLGSILGRRVLRISFIGKVLTPARYAVFQEKFEKYGPWVIFIARFTPGLRAAAFLSAGLSKSISFWRFLTLDGFAALISVPIWVYLGFYGAYERDKVLEWVHQGQVGILIVLATALVLGGILYWRRKKNRASKTSRDEILIKTVAATSSLEIESKKIREH